MPWILSFTSLWELQGRLIPAIATSRRRDCDKQIGFVSCNFAAAPLYTQKKWFISFLLHVMMSAEGFTCANLPSDEKGVTGSMRLDKWLDCAIKRLFFHAKQQILRC